MPTDQLQDRLRAVSRDHSGGVLPALPDCLLEDHGYVRLEPHLLAVAERHLWAHHRGCGHHIPQERGRIQMVSCYMVISLWMYCHVTEVLRDTHIDLALESTSAYKRESVIVQRQLKSGNTIVYPE